MRTNQSDFITFPSCLPTLAPAYFRGPLSDRSTMSCTSVETP